jgi:hypothetical protein
MSERSFRNTKGIPDKASLGEILDDVTAIAQCGFYAEAARYKQMLVNRRIRNVSPESMLDSEQIVAQNIGYLSGYASQKDRHRICDVFGTTHPFFGDTDPTPDEAFQMGKDWVKENKSS